MRSRTAALVAAAIASPALAQAVDVWLLHDDADGVINLGETVTWTLSVAFTGYPASATAGYMNASILANDPGLAGSSDMTYAPLLPFSYGGLSDGNGGIGWVGFTNVDYVGFGWPPAIYDNPLTVATFTTTGLSAGVLTYDFADGFSSGAFLEIAHSAFASTVFDLDEVTYSIDTLTIVPAPASALLLAPVGLLAVRRRR